MKAEVLPANMTVAHRNQSPLKISIITDKTAFQRLKREWNSLLAQCEHKSFFLTWDWLFNWWEFYGSMGAGKQLHIITARDEQGELTAILPLYKSSTSGAFVGKINLFYFIGSGYESSEYLDIIAAPHMTTDQLEQIFAVLSQPAIDGMYLSDVRHDSKLLPAMQNWCTQNGIYQNKRYWKTCPFIPLQEDYSHFIASLSKNMRYNVRRRTRNLEKKHAVEFKCISDAKQAEQYIRILFELHRKRWSTREGTSKFDDPQREVFHANIAEKLLTAGFLRLYVLLVDEVPVAILYCFAYDGHIYYYQAGMDPEFEKKSIGMVVMGKAIEASFAEGAHEYDFLRGLEDYKFRWTDKTRDTHILEIAFSNKATYFFKRQAQWRSLKKQIRKLLQFDFSSFTAVSEK